jgi:hypothetical protein
VVPFGGGSYEIRFAGRLSDSVLSVFECQARGLTVSVEPAAMCGTARCRTRPRSAACWTEPCRLAWRWSRSGGCPEHPSSLGEPEPPR